MVVLNSVEDRLADSIIEAFEALPNYSSLGAVTSRSSSDIDQTSNRVTVSIVKEQQLHPKLFIWDGQVLVRVEVDKDNHPGVLEKLLHQVNLAMEACYIDSFSSPNQVKVDYIVNQAGVVENDGSIDSRGLFFAITFRDLILV